MTTLQRYIKSMRDALRTPGAHTFFFPPSKERRKSANLRLAREIAPVLAESDPDEVKKELGSLYGLFIVSNSFDSIGVQVDNKEWLAELRTAMDAHLERYPRPASLS
jgi:hypothetical protein